jgi:hypothetical protein
MVSGGPFHYNYLPSTRSKKRVTHSTNGQQWNFFLKIKITIKSMLVIFLKWSTWKPLDIMTSGLVVISIGDNWVALDIHSNGFEWNCHSGIGRDLL